MKSYLSLIPASAKVHRRRNRMTLFCIIIAVFLVTAIFGVADMGIRMEKMHAAQNHGNWHIKLKNISQNDAEQIGTRSDVAAASWYAVRNLDMDEGYNIEGRQTAVCGVDEAFVTHIMNYFTEEAHLHDDGEIILSENARELLGVNVGGRITLNTPSGGYEFTISGFRSGDDRYTGSNGGETTALLLKEDQIGVFMNITAFRKICGFDNGSDSSPEYYIQFKNHTNIRKAITDIKGQYGLTDENIGLNTIVMAAMGVSDNVYIKNFYSIAGILFVLILTAGVLMISGSLNSNISQRTQFFGMLRCIGASKRQIIRFVRLEALNWCKAAIPAGVVLGIVITWGLCAVLRYMVGGEFADMPVFRISPVGIICGIVVGILTVLFAAQAPAKRAAKVPPMAAVVDSFEGRKKIRHAANMHFSKIETALGIHHAVSAKKNLILMTGSFALSIILFLSFSVLVELVGCLIPQKSVAPDLEISTRDLSNSIDPGLKDEISRQTGVEHVLGRMLRGGVSAVFSKKTSYDTVDLISYGEYQLGCLPKDKDLRRGSDVSKVYGDSGYVLTIYDKSNPLEIGDKIWIGGMELEIAGVLKYSPFSNDGSTGGKIDIICSEETFTRLTGESDYTIIDVQMEKGAVDGDVDRIRRLAGDAYEFRDRRGEADQNLYWAFILFVYGFLTIIALITVFNIINSVSMSVSAKMKQYGAMRAVGMDGRQITRMIAAEALTYALCGCIVGCIIGLPLSKLLYDYLITAHFSYFTWSAPVVPIVIILLFVAAASAAAIYGPSKRIKNMAVTDTIKEP